MTTSDSPRSVTDKAKVLHQHEQWQLREGADDRGLYCAACGELAEPRYPEHEKLRALEGKNDVVGEFLEWLGQQGYLIAKEREGSTRVEFEVAEPYGSRWESGRVDVAYWPEQRSTQAWLSAYFGIDEQKLSLEKDEMLRRIREQS